MKNYTVLLSNEAQYDIENLADIIMYKYKAPSTSIKYIQGLINEIKKLSRNAESFKIQTRQSLQQYGVNPRRINYKAMAIIYNIINETVYIRRVIPSNTISGL